MNIMFQDYVDFSHDFKSSSIYYTFVGGVLSIFTVDEAISLLLSPTLFTHVTVIWYVPRCSRLKFVATVRFVFVLYFPGPTAVPFDDFTLKTQFFMPLSPSLNPRNVAAKAQRLTHGIYKLSGNTRPLIGGVKSAVIPSVVARVNIPAMFHTRIVMK